ncbi:MAG: phosphatidylglycerophosphatase A [Fimbriimonadaceae bacterium]|nr:phosphatidylglycerophosphatase A [Alphaproteobacteria bacterium]
MKKGSIHYWLATWFGTGLSPVAPGTIGTLATVPLHFALVELPYWGHFAFILVLVLVGTWSAGCLSRELQVEDPQIVVIDESVGILLTFWLVGSSTVIAIVTAIFLFRILDIVKPWPINMAERLRPAGIGIMADDLAAGLAAGLLTRFIV